MANAKRLYIIQQKLEDGLLNLLPETVAQQVVQETALRFVQRNQILLGGTFSAWTPDETGGEFIDGTNESTWSAKLVQATQTGNITLTLPNRTGIIALTDDLPSLSAYDGLLDGTYLNGEFKFEPWGAAGNGKLSWTSSPTTGTTNLSYSGHFYANKYNNLELIETTYGFTISAGSTDKNSIIFNDSSSWQGNLTLNAQANKAVNVYSNLTIGNISTNASFIIESDSAGAGLTRTLTLGTAGTANQVAIFNSVSGLTGENQLAVSRGGTGVSTANANIIFAGPTTGTAAAPSFRSLVNADIPTSLSISDITLSGDLAVNGGDLTSTAATFNLLNTGVTTVNAFSEAKNVSIGYSGTDTSTTVISGGITNASKTKTLNIGTGADSSGATSINIGASGAGAINSVITIYGDLNVTGTINTVSTEEIKISDNIIILNSDYVGSNPTESAGIKINRGTLDDATLYWDEGEDRWEVNGSPIALKDTALSQFASTTSAELAGVLSDETGFSSGAKAVFNISPILTTPDINGGTVDSLTSLSVRDASAAFDLIIAGSSSVAFASNRTLTLDLVNANRTLKLTGSPSLSGITTSGSGTLALNKNLTIANTYDFTLEADGAARTLKISNASKEIAGAATILTFGGNFTHTGAHTLGLTTTANTSLTLPTTGTLATLAGTEALTNKTINNLTLTAQSIGFTIAGGTTSKTLTLSDSTTLGTNAITFASTKSVTAQHASLTIGDGTGTGTITLKSDSSNARTLTLTGNPSIGTLTLSPASTGFTIAGGTTSKTLTLSDSTTLGTNAITFASTKSVTAQHASLTIGDGTGTGTITLKSNNSNARTLILSGDSNINTLSNGHALYASAANTISGEAQLSVSRGGTGLGSYTLGDVIYASDTTTLAKLGGNTTTTKKFLRQTGTGSASAAPGWDVLINEDLPDSPTVAADIDAYNLEYDPDITSMTYTAVSVNKKGIVTAGAYVLEVGAPGQTMPSAELLFGGLFFKDVTPQP